MRRIFCGLIFYDLILCGAGGCTPILHGAISVEGAPFSPTRCRTGEAYGWNGVELADERGYRLRLATGPSGAADAWWFAPGARVGRALGGCGPLEIARQASRINGMYNVYGRAELSCSATGAIDFKNCH